jgi:hypothetical protein
MPWASYAERLQDEWQRVMREANSSEPTLQRFIEHHPSLLVGLAGPAGFARRRPFPGGVISQPELLGVTKKRPDFMWIGHDSAFLHPILIEIETPAKKWFNKNEVVSQHFVHSHDQILDWKAWFDVDANRSMFHEAYSIPDQLCRGRKLQPEYVLVAGSYEAEFRSNPNLNQKRAPLARPNEVLATFDRLTPSWEGADLFTVRLGKNGYEAVAFLPTFRIRPADAHWLSLVRNKESALDASEWFDPDRVSFLKRRFQYWDELGSANAVRYVRGNDVE